jgi:GNAT superfamily N-acetyltransferase
MAIHEHLEIRRYAPSDREAVWTLHVKGLEAVGSRAKNPEACGLDADFEDIDRAYRGGLFLVGSINDSLVAMGGLKRLSSSVAEIARMRVDPQHWRRGYGEAIFRHLEVAASALGYTELWLDTLPAMAAAESLYRKNGFREFGRTHLLGYEAREAILFVKKKTT